MGLIIIKPSLEFLNSRAIFKTHTLSLRNSFSPKERVWQSGKSVSSSHLHKFVGRVQHFSLNTTLKFMYLSCWMTIVQHDLQTLRSFGVMRKNVNGAKNCTLRFLNKIRSKSNIYFFVNCRVQFFAPLIFYICRSESQNVGGKSVSGSHLF